MPMAAWIDSGSAEHRSEFSTILSRPRLPPLEPPRWNLADILNPPPRKPQYRSPRVIKASSAMDFALPAQQHGIFSPHEMDQQFGMRTPEPESNNYELFASSSGNGFNPQYRRHGSSASSMGSGYGLLGEGNYQHAGFNDPMQSFNGASGNNFGNVLNNPPSAFSSGRVSPLTPNDSSHPSGFPQYDFSDRRLSNGFSDLSDDYSMGGVSSGYLPPFNERLARFNLSNSNAGIAPHVRGADALRSVAPHATGSFRENGSFEDSTYAPQGDMSMRSMSGVDEQLARIGLRPQPSLGMTNDVQSFIRPYLEQYTTTSNRLAFGERTVIVMSSRVAQKSYGTEKRFLCPPPTAILIGNSWWSDAHRRGEESKLSSPRVVVSISGETSPQEGTIEWTGSSGKSFDVNDPPTGTTYVGRCVGKQLFISDIDEKKKKVEALVKISAPATDDEPERVIGIFPSRSIKVISKPSKKRQSAKNLELCINHGSTISLFHRLRSQTVSTKYLCVSGSGSSFKGSDGAPLMGLDNRARATSPSFIARTASWDPFVMYIVDVNKPAGGVDTPPPPPVQPDYPSPPPNAIPFTNNGSQIPIYYNQTVVLQCLTSGVVSPVLIIRKVDHQTTVVGGGLQDGAKPIADHNCAPGEVCGDPVSQLHKIAFEVYDGTKNQQAHGGPGVSGAFLSCMGEKVNTYRPIEGRQWHASVSPMPSSPLATNGTDYFGQDSAPASPSSAEYIPGTNDGGRVRKKRSTSSASNTSRNVAKNRRRPSSAGSTNSARRGSTNDTIGTSGALWQVDIGETSVWTIVGTDQVRYNFYVPPVLFDNQGGPSHMNTPSTPVTPFPNVVKYLPPDRASEVPKSNCAQSRSAMAKPNPHQSKMLTVYGENFNKAEPIHVYFGSEPSPYVEVRCTEVLGCLPPEGPPIKRKPVILVRSDGVVFPTSTMYP